MMKTRSWPAFSLAALLARPCVHLLFVVLSVFYQLIRVHAAVPAALGSSSTMPKTLVCLAISPGSYIDSSSSIHYGR
ncbi:hypothetical protein C8R47DRAFT_226067 [Mycena vitilis]|nr:hypothetical protein C8R47DRAFT_226067 [Mycena vitilis]